MSTDGESDDDPGLQGLRSMWLSMPDEDPPARGLDALMAAARVKAEEMAKPSLWQRFAAMFARPPVLALATVVVLVGGAVLVGTRRDEMEAQAPASRSEVAITQSAPHETVPVVPAPDPAAAPAVEAEPLHNAGPAGLATARPERAKAPPPAKRPAPRTTDIKTATKAPPKAKASAKPMAKNDSGADFEGSIGGVATGGAAPSPDMTTRDQVAREPAGDFASSKSAEKAEPADRESTVVQLHKRALAAAARGDCESARTAIKRIQAQDAAYYKSKVAGDSALRGCLAN